MSSWSFKLLADGLVREVNARMGEGVIVLSGWS